MADFVVEQALYRKEHEQTPQVQARSSGFRDDWLADAERLIDGFGERMVGVTCPLALFAHPLNAEQVAIVRVIDQPMGTSAKPALAFHFLVIARVDYEQHVGDAFSGAQRAAVNWNARGALPSLTWTVEPLPPRTLSQVQAVLQRVKAGALQEDEDPQKVERTVENSESPALLGGVQVLVDGGKLAFVRPAPDPKLVQGLWTLLPHSLRGKLWPATFAFSNDLQFDVIVMPHEGELRLEGYTTEDQAADYPAGSYELALQTAAETGTQADLEAVFSRRTSGETLRLAWQILIVMALLVAGGYFFSPPPPRPFPVPTRAALAAGIIAVGDPWTALSMMELGNQQLKRDTEAKR